MCAISVTLSLPPLFRMLIRGLPILFQGFYMKRSNKTVPDMFRASVKKYQDKVIFINEADGSKWTFNQVNIKQCAEKKNLVLFPLCNFSRSKSTATKWRIISWPKDSRRETALHSTWKTGRNTLRHGEKEKKTRLKQR